MIPHLQLVTDATPLPQAEQLILRPVVPFVREGLGAPIEIWRECWKGRPRRARRVRSAGEVLELFNRPRRPFKFAECEADPRPCPFVSCRHHLALDVRADGGLTINFPGLEADPGAVLAAAPFTCSLKRAAAGEMMLEDIAPIFDVTSERISQISTEAERKYEDGVVKLSSVVDLIEDRWR